MATVRSRRTADDRVALTVGTSVLAPVPLAAIVCPVPTRQVPSLEVRRMPATDALLRLLGLARVEGWSRPDVVRRDFARLSALANDVPVYTALVPWGPPFDSSLPAELARLARPSE